MRIVSIVQRPISYQKPRPFLLKDNSSFWPKTRKYFPIIYIRWFSSFFHFFSLQVYCVTLLATGEKLAAKEVQIDLQIPQTKEVTILLLIKVKITLYERVSANSNKLL